MKPFFSIIVPCCDVEPYVRECLDSVLRQDFRDWECLLGVETSKDRTEEVVREYAAKDPRFKVFTGPRSGSCSAARNTGIDTATGEYLIFLDGDDTITEGSLQRLHDKIAERPGADLYPCAVQVLDAKAGKVTEIRDNYPADAKPEFTGPEATLYIAGIRKHPHPMMQLTICRRASMIPTRWPSSFWAFSSTRTAPCAMLRLPLQPDRLRGDVSQQEGPAQGRGHNPPDAFRIPLPGELQSRL